MKTKKPARIKGRVVYTNNPDFHTLFASKPELPHWTTPHMILPIDNPDALVEQVARAIRDDEQKYNCGATYDDHARAALRSIGVPLKKAK